VGTVLDSPCLSHRAREKNFSNEGGIGGKTNFLKNVNGMWLIQQCINDWNSRGETWTVEKLVQGCSSMPVPQYLLDVDDPDLLSPGHMPGRLNAQLVRRGLPAIPDGDGAATQIANLVFHSLAVRYASVLRDIANITGKKLHRLYIVGGGSKNVR
jgi:rhamnulokinase